MPPNALIDALQGVRRRIRALTTLYGLGVMISLAVGLLLAVILSDYLLNLPVVPRVLLLVTSLALLAYHTRKHLLKPVLADLPLTDLAGRLEQSFPQFGDRLRSTVEFMRGSIPGSPAMQQRVISQTSDIARNLDLNRAVVAKPAYQSAGLAALALVGLFLLGWMLPQYASIAFSRLFAPLAAHPWPKRVQIEMLDQTPLRLAVGQHLDLHLKLVRGDSASRKASLVYQFGDGPIQRELMTRGPDGTYSSSLETRITDASVSAPLKVSVQAGDDEITLKPITIVPRLAIQEVIAQITPPPYVSRRAPQSINLAAAPATLAEGGDLAIRVVFNKPLGERSLPHIEPTNPDAKLPEILWTSNDARTKVGHLSPRTSMRFHLRATDTDGFSNNAIEEYEVIVKPDALPSVQIDNPRRNEERTPDAVIPLSGLAEDDYGVDSVALISERLSDSKQWTRSLLKQATADSGAQLSNADSSVDRQRLRLDYGWDLPQLVDAKLKPGDVLEYHLEATDNFRIGDQAHPAASSGRLRITIISQEDLTSRVSDDLRQLKQQISTIRSNQDRNRQETVSLLDDTKNKPALDAADLKTLGRLSDQQTAAAAQTKQMADSMSALNQRLTENKSTSRELSDLTREVSQQLQQTAESSMKDASAQLAAAKQAADAKQPASPSLEGSAERQQRASDQLGQSLDRMANIGSLQTAIDNLRKMIEAQQAVSQQTQDLGKNNLGKTPEQMSAADRDKLQQAADAQAKLAQQTGKTLEEMQKLADQMAKNDPAAAETLRKAASAGQQQQVSRNQQKAADNARENQQSQAQASQKQAELGLQEMLGNLKQAEQRKLAELQKQLEELQGQIANLIRHQAGHNLDNLTLQGPDKLKQIGDKTLAELTLKAERNQPPPTPTPLATLIASQEQTEQNARDIVKLAEAAKDGAEAASNLTRAAGRMEHAIVALKDAQLPAAYDPSQVEALAALDHAKKIIDDQKAKVDQQVADQNNESVRDQYVQIKAEQQKLNDQTSDIEKTRGQDGSLNRVSAVKLAQLPDQQSKLSDRVSKLNEALNAAGSTVYIWSNKDIANNMTKVRDQLAAKQSGQPVQLRQSQIADQLDAMIRNLVTKPKESKFAQDAGGGGGQKGQSANPGPKLPSESELRLLQDLQRSINTSTKQLDQPNKDKAALIDLGSRQAELRGLLDETLQKASRGKMKLPPEPDNKDQLPEESNAEAIENNELDQQLLSGVPDEEKNDKDAALIGDRMARSRQRLTLSNDAGKVTQAIQNKILTDMDYLIDQARKQQIEQRNPPPSDPNQQKMNQPKPNQQMAQQQPQPGQQRQTGVTPAAQSAAPGHGQQQTDLSTDIKQSAAEWGAISPRLRDAAIDSAGENVIERYRKLVQDYYISVNKQGAGQQQ